MLWETDVSQLLTHNQRRRQQFRDADRPRTEEGKFLGSSGQFRKPAKSARCVTLVQQGRSNLYQHLEEDYYQDQCGGLRVYRIYRCTGHSTHAARKQIRPP